MIIPHWPLKLVLIQDIPWCPKIPTYELKQSLHQKTAQLGKMKSRLLVKGLQQWDCPLPGLGPTLTSCPCYRKQYLSPTPNPGVTPPGVIGRRKNAWVIKTLGKQLTQRLKCKKVLVHQSKTYMQPGLSVVIALSPVIVLAGLAVLQGNYQSTLTPDGESISRFAL